MTELETLKVDAYNLMVKITKAKSELEMMGEQFNRMSEAIEKIESVGETDNTNTATAE